MQSLLDIAADYGDHANLVLMALVFIPTATVAFFVMTAIRVRGAVKRRAAGISSDMLMSAGGNHSLRHTSIKAAQRLIDRTTKHYSSFDDKNMKLLRQRLVQAGIFDPRAVGFFFLTRGVLAITLAALAYFMVPALTTVRKSAVAVRRRRRAVGLPDAEPRARPHRVDPPPGVPGRISGHDGLACGMRRCRSRLAAAFERVGRELGDSYPNLSANIHLANLEIRAGRTISEALEHFGDRLGLAEVRSFATLIQQSDELGSSITDALRVYSEDMRHKRLSTAEEKAYALPSKLTIPLMVCVFPVLFVVILLPVVVRVKMGAY